MDKIYNIQPLADSGGTCLSTYLGEILYVYNRGIINMRRLEGILKEPNYSSQYRLFLLNPDETVDSEIPQEDLIINSGSFSENYQSGQRKNVNISLINKNGKYTPNINTIWVQNRFRLDVGVEYQGEIYWFPRGIYVLGNPTATHYTSDQQVSLTLVDKFAILEGKTGTLEATYEIPEGTDIESAIREILTLDNGSGYPIDLQDIVYDSTFKGKTMPNTLSKDAGSTLADLILDIATILNAECFYNSLGHLTFTNINETTTDSNKPTLWYYTDKEAEYFSSSLSYNFESVVNEIQIVGDSVENEVYYASAKNLSPESPICIQNIGRRIEYINDANIYSNELAQDRANYELRKRGILETTINIEVAFNPLLFVNNLIAIEDEFLNYQRAEFLIQSISYNLGGDNKMTLSCSNLTNFDTRLSDLSSINVGDELSSRTLVFNFPDDLNWWEWYNNYAWTIISSDNYRLAIRYKLPSDDWHNPDLTEYATIELTDYRSGNVTAVFYRYDVREGVGGNGLKINLKSYELPNDFGLVTTTNKDDRYGDYYNRIKVETLN